jgi:hypothetical protein
VYEAAAASLARNNRKVEPKMLGSAKRKVKLTIRFISALKLNGTRTDFGNAGAWEHACA